ncbi:MAG TPA: tRNA pseudouridine synthase A [Solirubrobacteraceae bacterium]|jgi:tRNA pseudouridine38-40 synthase|nr:tRNA pseudouridine synthase A [Solirubrobacteraceae bacterium]
MVSKLTLQYDGSEFAGWACQAGQRTVQGELERALRTILGDTDTEGGPLTLTVAGRTDRGAHAWGQVASYRHEALDPLRLNSLLPNDMAVLACEPASDSFDARRSATSRTYCYRVLARRTRDVFERGRALWWPRPLDLDLLKQCAKLLPGKHDFTAFTPTETEHTRFEREVRSAEWRVAGGPLAARARQPGDVLELWIEADTFLRHMNRVLVGTMLEVAAGRRELAEFAELLRGRPRAHAGPTAPAHGLALVSVAYPES